MLRERVFFQITGKGVRSVGKALHSFLTFRGVGLYICLVDLRKMSERIRISNESLNCYKTWIRTAGVELGQFHRNPVMLWMHMRGLIIGCIKDIRVDGEDITGVPFFDEVTEESRRAKAQWEKGTLRMGSPNFEVLETSDAPELMKEGQMAPTITRCKLLEYSMVDIGGNDDNIRLQYEGEELKTENAGAMLALALNNKKHFSKNKKMDETKIQAIALMLGMNAESSLEDVQKEVKNLLLAKTECETLRGEVVKLQAEVKGLKQAGIASMVDEAIALGKIDAGNRDHFVDLGEKVGAESLKLTLEAMRVGAKPSMLLGKRADTKSAKKWTEMSDEELKLMRDENKRLYREEFGVECVIA